MHPCRIPRAPPVVRRARFVTALPTAPVHFQQPVRGGSWEGIHNCLQGFGRSQDACLDRLCDELSLLSNSLASSCEATNARVAGGCEEIKNLLSNCVESMAGLTPPAYDELGKIKLPSIRVGTSEFCKVSEGNRQLIFSGYTDIDAFHRILDSTPDLRCSGHFPAEYVCAPLLPCLFCPGTRSAST